MPRNSTACAAVRRRPTDLTRGQAGFTLLELLVALTLLGLVLAIVFSELRFATRAWDAADAKLDRNGELLSVHAFLRARLQQVHVKPAARPQENDDAAVSFDGNSRSMEFLATMPVNISDGGFYEISLSSRIGNDGNNLFISWRPYDEDGTASVADTHDNSRILLQGIREVRFSYFGRTGDALTPQWWDNWPSRDAAPSLIRMRVSFADDDPRSWPELVVATTGANSVLRQR